VSVASADDESVPGEEAELVRTLKGHVTAVTSLAFSPSALLLVSGCSKGWMNVWALQVHLITSQRLFAIHWCFVLYYLLTLCYRPNSTGLILLYWWICIF